jgi:hypothetical protein
MLGPVPLSRPRARHNGESAPSLALLTTASQASTLHGLSAQLTGSGCHLVFPRLKVLSGSEKMRVSKEMLDSGLLHVKRDLFQIPKAAEVGRDARRRTS